MIDYSMLEYWDERFSNNAGAFEWLKGPEELLPIIRQLLTALPEEDRRMLHIGSGSSSLSLRLRELVRTPAQIHNVDFSQVALEVGRELEDNSIDHPDELELPNMRMTWSRVDLLNMKDIVSLQARSKIHGAFNMIVDKSTSDAIACGEPLGLSCLDFDLGMKSLETYRVYPVWRLALHMAVLTEPGALWIVLSYKEERFYFLNPAALSLDLKGQDIPNEMLPSHYWGLKSKQFITDEHQNSEMSASAPVYRPVEGKWLLVLQRTENSLAIKEENNE